MVGTQKWGMNEWLGMNEWWRWKNGGDGRRVGMEEGGNGGDKCSISSKIRAL